MYHFVWGHLAVLKDVAPLSLFSAIVVLVSYLPYVFIVAGNDNKDTTWYRSWGSYVPYPLENVLENARKLVTIPDERLWVDRVE